MRSTMPGRLTASQLLSIGRSISLTRSSSVRALLPRTVLASELNALSTAERVDADIRPRSSAGAGGAGGGNGVRAASAASPRSANTTSEAPSILLYADVVGGG